MYNASIYDDTPMDDSDIFCPKVAKDEVVLGVYGSEEWVLSDFIRRRHLSGASTIQLDITWLTLAGFKFAEWVPSFSARFTFFGPRSALIFEGNNLVRVSCSRDKLEMQLIGDVEWATKVSARLDATFRRAESMIRWVYSTDGHEINVPLNYRPAIKSAYPWIEKPLDNYIDDYLNSEASVLILIGPPGTGKTTFIKNLIHRSTGDAMVAYDEKVMMGDQLFATFIDSSTRFLIMEDADAFLQSRTDGNTMMHKFLNVSDGLISAADKKLVFSTNLPSRTDIDEALMRPGRCFDVVEFRPLTRDEAKDVVAETGRGELPSGNSISLAQILSTQPSGTKRSTKSMGFI